MNIIMNAQSSARKTIQQHTDTNDQTKTSTSSAQMEKATQMLIDTDEGTHTDSIQVY